MSIYDDLANSDFVDKGKFKAQLREMGHVVQEEESVIEDNYGQGENESSSNDFNPAKMNAESLKRQKVIQDNNPMDDENEASLMRNKGMYEAKAIAQKKGDLDVQDQLNYLKQKVDGQNPQNKRQKFQNQIQQRQDNTDEKLFDNEAADVYRNLPNETEAERNQQRKKMIFDDDTEGEDHNN